jgi:hypothetical protein
MTPKRMLLGLGLAACLAGTAFLAREAEGPGMRMVTAGEKFVGSLKADQKAKCVFAFDDKERTRWFFTPKQKGKDPERKGLRLEEMTDAQKKLGLELVRTGTSESGYEKATTIMSLEAILAELEKGRGPVRKPGWYFFTVFGTPSKTGKWGWRVEGHHLSLNFTLEGARIVSSTPAFFGANPAEVKGGKRKGLRTLPEAEDSARRLFKSLDEGQRKLAFRKEKFPEIKEGTAKPAPGKPVGLPGAKMTAKQKDLLLKLIEGYARRMPEEVSARQVGEVKKGGLARVYFALGGGDGTPGKPYTYRVQGPGFVIEFLNEQRDSAGNPANHIHSAWRDLKGDFGLGE